MNSANSPDHRVDDAPISSAQAVAARAMLGWSVRYAAQMSGAGVNTITRFELGSDARAATRRALRLAYEAAGITFLRDNGAGPGIRLRVPPGD